MTSHALKRVTVDMPEEEHRYLKMAAASKGFTIREFVMKAVERSIEDYENELDAKRANEVIESINRGETKTIPWEEMEKKLGWDVL